MKILAIESSCDETAAAVIEDGRRILSNVVVSQIDIFAEYGGVIPEVAARSHLEAILPVVHKAMEDAGLGKDEIDAIAVTHTPGLLGSLLIGTLTARMLAILWGKPLYAVHHLKSHIYANWLMSEPAPTALTQPEVNLSKSNPSDEGRDFEQVQPRESSSKVSQEQLVQTSLVSQSNDYGDGGEVRGSLCSSKELFATNGERAKRGVPVTTGDDEVGSEKSEDCSLILPTFPLLALVVSGGHTQIIYMRGHNQFEIIGTTRDDAVGECFDKVAKILGLPYPGGPAIDQAALRGDKTRYKLPQPKVEGLDFSFSGLKTAVLRAVQAACDLPITTPSYELKEHLSEQQRDDFAAAFQETACNILIDKLKMALEEHPEVKSVVVAGGVSANAVLRQKAIDELSGASEGGLAGFGGQDLVSERRKVYFPERKFAGDNAAMVGAAAYYEIMAGAQPTDPYTLNIAPRTAISAE